MAVVLIVCPSTRDELNLAAYPRAGALELARAGRPVDGDLDPLAFLDAQTLAASSVDGIFGSTDTTGHLAAMLAERLGLPGPGRAAFMRCHDKLASRRIQADAVPEATPRFAAVDLDDPPGHPPLPYPFFLKPVTGHLSQLAYRVHDADGYAAALEHADRAIDSVTAFDARLEGRPFRTLIAEELLEGALVTLEGFASRGAIVPVGVTDAVMHPNRISFLRFDHPSAVAPAAVAAMERIAERLMPALGFDQGLFNIEFFVRPDGRPAIVEVNGRMASQFAPFARATYGVSTYELGLELAAGATPELPPARPGVVASSFVVRAFVEDARVAALPDLGLVRERFPDAHVELLVREGQLLSENDDDAMSHRLAVVALAGSDRRALVRRFARLRRLLQFELEPVLVAAGEPG